MGNEAGWYQDPSNTPQQQRYWDGAQWTESTRLLPNGVVPPPPVHAPKQQNIEGTALASVLKSGASWLKTIGPSTYVGAAAIALLLMLGLVSGYFFLYLVFAVLLLTLTGMYSLLTGRKSWARLAGRKAGAVTIGVCVVGFFAASAGIAGTTPRTAGAASSTGQEVAAAKSAEPATSSSPSMGATPTALPSAPAPVSPPTAVGAVQPPAVPPSRDVQAVTVLKQTTNLYRDRLNEGRGYQASGQNDQFELWWTTMNTGKFVSNAQVAYMDASQPYGDNIPQAIDDWDTLMDVKGDFINDVNQWYAGRTDANFARITSDLDTADKIADKIATGVTVEPTNGTTAVSGLTPPPAPMLAPEPQRVQAAAVLQKANDYYRTQFEKGVSLNLKPEQTDWWISTRLGFDVATSGNAFSEADKSFDATNEPVSITQWRDLTGSGLLADIQHWYQSDTGTGQSTDTRAKVDADLAQMDNLVKRVSAGQ